MDLMKWMTCCLTLIVVTVTAADVTVPPQGTSGGAKNASGTRAALVAVPHVHGNKVAVPVPRGGVFPRPAAASSSSSSARTEHEYYSYEYSDEPLTSDSNNSGKKEASSWLVPDPEQLTAAERAAEERAAAARHHEQSRPEQEREQVDEDEEDELPDNSLADGDLHDHDMMDSVMYIYFGPNPRGEGGTTAQVVLAGAAVALFAQALTALGSIRKALRSKCRRGGVHGSPGGFERGGPHGTSAGSLQAAMVLLHTEIALIMASLVFIFSVHGTADRSRCQAVALLLHYLHLAAACWITANCVRIFLWLVHEAAPPPPPAQPSTPRLSPGLQALAVAAWALPLLLVLLSFLIHANGYEARHYCWLSVHKGMLVSFLIPLGALIAANTTLAVMGIRRAPHKIHSSPSEDAARLALRLNTAALPLFAVSWFFGVLALEQSQSLAAALLYAATAAIFNWFIFACSGSLFPECPVTPVRYSLHPLTLHHAGSMHCPLVAHPAMSAPPSPSQHHDSQPLLSSSGQGHHEGSSRGWSQGWTPSSHPELPVSPVQRCRVMAWRESDGAAGGLDENEGVAAVVSLGGGGAHEDDLEVGETSGLLEMRLENISTIST